MNRFSLKVFFAIFTAGASALIVSSVIILKYIAAHTETEYVKRYQRFAGHVSDTLVQLDNTTDSIMRNALYVLAEKEKVHGLPSNQELLGLAKKLGVESFYITDRSGRFIRSDWFLTTQQNPSLKKVHETNPLSKSLFSYCADYHKLITGHSLIERTPIVPSGNHGWPYKFTMIPNSQRTRVLEADMAMNFIGEILTNAMKPDSSVISIGLFTPSGTVLGNVRSDREKFSKATHLDVHAISFIRPQVVAASYIFFTRVPATVENCCECRVKGLALSDGTYFYILRTEVSRTPLNAQVQALWARLLSISFMVLIVSGILAYVLSRHLVRRLAAMERHVKMVAENNDLNARLRLSGQDEIAILAKAFDSMLDQLQASHRRLADSEKEKALINLAQQVAHDIRSPLAALDSATQIITVLPESHRIIIRGAINRIRDIANHLLYKYREAGAVLGTRDSILSPLSHDAPQVCLLSSLIDSLVGEKRLQYRVRRAITIDARSEEASYGLFANVQPIEFKRLISNLIDNAVDALEGRDNGLTTVCLRKSKDFVRVEVTDNGRGVPHDLLLKLGDRGISQGKSEGFGLGLHHAKTCAESWGGHLEIVSEVGKGTTVALLLPKVQPPSWFVSQLILDIHSPIIILDDDKSIHHVWQRRISALDLENAIQIEHFSVPQELRRWVYENPLAAGAALYLLDYEFLGCVETGLSLASELGIGNRTILVTSRYEESVILEGCKQLQMRLIPKGLAGFVPIQIETLSDPLDAVLIDDDPLVRKTWELSAAKSNKRFRSFATTKEFFQNINTINRKTPIYVDVSLANGINGAECSAEIYAQGFQRIYLATGHAAINLQASSHVTRVMGKEPPWQNSD